MDEKELKKLIQVAAKLLVEQAFVLIESDPHQFSSRPCSTCDAISTMIDRKFGCCKKYTR